VSTLTHPPGYSTDFPAYSRYVSTTPFLLSHLGASFLGAAIGVLGLLALVILLVSGRTARLALARLVTSVIASVLCTSVAGVAAFAQPAIGRAYLGGHAEQAIAINSDVYGPPLFATALPGLLLFAVGTERSLAWRWRAPGGCQGGRGSASPSAA
jgi:hypothetical protein